MEVEGCGEGREAEEEREGLRLRVLVSEESVKRGLKALSCLRIVIWRMFKDGWGVVDVMVEL